MKKKSVEAHKQTQIVLEYIVKIPLISLSHLKMKNNLMKKQNYFLETFNNHQEIILQKLNNGQTEIIIRKKLLKN